MSRDDDNRALRTAYRRQHQLWTRTTDWCGPCKMLAPILKDVKTEMGDQVKIVKIDVDRNQELAAKYQVRGVPTMILYKNGKQLWRQSGVLQKHQITEVIKSHS